jgi:hypothetical protein
MSSLGWRAASSRRLGTRCDSNTVLLYRKYIVIASAVKQDARQQRNLGAVDVELTPAGLAEIETACSSIRISGERYGESSAKLIDR